MSKPDILIQGRKLNAHQKTIVLNTFPARPNGMSDDTWLKTHSFWFSHKGNTLSNTKHYPHRNDSVAKDESLKVTYSLKGNSLFNLVIINNKTGNKYIDVKGLDVDDLRDCIRDRFPDYYSKIWSAVAGLFNSGKNDGYSINGQFLYNSMGNETLKI